jgi:hypothetical protein
LPNFKKNGLLPQGVYPCRWKEFLTVFAINAHRLQLSDGLFAGLKALKKFGCNTVYVDGSYVTAKPFPNDVDVAFDNTNMDWKGLKKHHPEFFDIANGDTIQKEKYSSHFFACNAFETYFIDFFQFDRNGNPKGIVKLNLDEVFTDDKERQTI